MSDFSDGELEEIEFLLSHDSDVSDLHVTEIEHITDHFIDIADISSIFVESEVGTQPVANQTMQAKFKDIFTNQPNQLQVFVNKLYAKINHMFETSCGDVSEKSTEPNIWTKYHSELYQYSVSSEYVGLVRSLILSEPSGSDFQICSEIFDKVTTTVLERHTNVTATTSNCPSRQEMSDSCKGKLRYIFGRCIAKSRYHNMKQAMNNLYSKSKANTLSKQFLKVKMLDSLTKNYSELESTSKYKETLYQTQRKQNLTEGLTNIDDTVFEFILKVENKRQVTQTDTSFSVYGSDVLSYTRYKLLKDLNLFENWKNLFSDFEIAESIVRIPSDDALECLNELFIDIVERFCKIADNEFRKQLLRDFGKKKTERLRKRVDIKQKGPGICTLSMKNMYADKSDRKTSSHLKLKSLIFDNDKVCFQNFVKKDLMKLCNAYDIQVPSHITNEVLKKKLCSAIASAGDICHPECLTESSSIQVSVPVAENPTPSTSAQSVECQLKPNKKRRMSKYTSKSKKKTKQTDQTKHITICPLCEKVHEKGDDDWLACDLCDVWYDRQCLNISDSQWDEIEDEDWYCPNCLK